MHPLAASPLVGYNQLSGVLPAHYAIEDYRRIRAELSAIRDELRYCGADDLSQRVTKWCDTFERFLMEDVRSDVDLQPIIRMAIPYMQRVFRCSLPPHRPLDETALLGSDGKVYSPISSPLPPLTMAPHPLASCLVRWLAGYGACLHIPQRVDDEEDRLAEELARQLRAARSRRRDRAEKAAHVEPELEQFEGELRAAVVAEMARHEEAMHQIAAEHHVNLDAVETRIEDLAARVHPIVNELRQANQDLSADTEARRRETEELRDMLQQRDREITALERSTAQLKIEVNELHERLNERDRERNDNLIQTVLIIAACVIICKLLPPASAALAEALGLGGAAASGAGSGAAAAATAGTAVTSSGLNIGVAPVSGGAKIGLFVTW